MQVTKEMKAIVVFHDRGKGFWVWLFGRPGFRHCFVALNDGRAWTVIDGRGDGLHVESDLPAAYDLAGFYRARGMTVVETTVRDSARRRYGIAWMSCVEVVKRVLNRQGWWIWTPHHLYRVLIRERREQHRQHLQPAETEASRSAAAADP